MFCAEGLRLMDRALERVLTHPHDLHARSDVMMAAYCAGMAINTTGRPLTHAVQSPMAAIGHTPHGIGVGALLPMSCASICPIARGVLPRSVGFLVFSGPDSAGAGIARIDALLAAAGVPGDIAALASRLLIFRRSPRPAFWPNACLDNPAPNDARDSDRTAVPAPIVATAAPHRLYTAREEAPCLHRKSATKTPGVPVRIGELECTTIWTVTSTTDTRASFRNAPPEEMLALKKAYRLPLDHIPIDLNPVRRQHG